MLSENGWCVYLLRCGDGTLYCGITNDFAKRLAAHRAGRGARYTRGRGPLRTLYREPCADRSAALKREHAIKQLPRAAKLRLRTLTPRRRARYDPALSATAKKSPNAKAKTARKTPRGKEEP